MIEPILLTAARVETFNDMLPMTNASGFYFEREGRLFLVTSRHVVFDEASGHFPNRMNVELHIDAVNLQRSTFFSIPLYRDGKSTWIQGLDSAGDIDVAVIELDRRALPDSVVLNAFSPAHLYAPSEQIAVGSPLSIIGFPLGFHDLLHHMPVVRHAVMASSFGLRFQGEGYFLTDARTHRGTSGAPVVIRKTTETSDQGDLGWRLLGIHSARLDVDTRNLKLDEALGLNCAWYADILMTLTGE